MKCLPNSRRTLGPAIAALALALAPAPALAQRDIHSYARPDEARVTDVALDLRADFERQRLAGTATLTFEAAPGARRIVLDTKDLVIRAVNDAAGRPQPYELGEADPNLGRPLSVTLPARRPGASAPERRRQEAARPDLRAPVEGRTIVVVYETSPDAGALQWLTPEMTAGGEQPFLFTQGQAILTRTWVPTQDSPGIRQSYSARIVVPEPLTAVMSAEMLTPEGEPVGQPGWQAYRFRLDTPVPPYLIALAVGDLAFQEVGPRTGVWAEPSVVEKAAWEFADMERMLSAAERLYGPYRWGRYDVLVLPPSFPFGGMENPRLTFATPTVLAGDRSLVALIAHELAHSWSGNLVTNATWSDFWLNEGFTSYIENRIMEALYGEEYAAMLRVLAQEGLRAELAELPPADTRLHIDLAGRDPDEGMTGVPYDKGATFLRLLEETVGRDRFDAFLRRYFDEHAFQPMTTAGFLDYLRAHLIGGDSALEARIRPEEWLYGTGLPANAPAAVSDRFEKVEAQAAAFAAGATAASLATDGWSTHEWLHFLRSLPQTLAQPRLRELDAAFELTETGNSEILFEWLRVAIRNRYEPAFPALERFLTSQGRRKFVRPLFADLVAQDWGRALALRIYERARPRYHPVTAGSVDELLGPLRRARSGCGCGRASPRPRA